MPDSTTPLCTWPQLTQGAFADLAREVTDPSVQNDLLLEATRICEGMAGDRRLAPFTGLVESHRLDGVDPDEYTDAANLPLDLAGTLGRSYAYSIGASTLVRHCWLNEFAPRHTELWTYSDITLTITRSYGGSQTLTVNQYTGPELDSGHVWFNLGQFIPIGSYGRITYSGGYTIAIPADLVRAGKYATAALLVREIQPTPIQHDPEVLMKNADRIMGTYSREGSRDAVHS